MTNNPFVCVSIAITIDKRRPRLTQHGSIDYNNFKISGMLLRFCFKMWVHLELIHPPIESIHLDVDLNTDPLLKRLFSAGWFAAVQHQEKRAHGCPSVCQRNAFVPVDLDRDTTFSKRILLGLETSGKVLVGDRYSPYFALFYFF